MVNNVSRRHILQMGAAALALMTGDGALAAVADTVSPEMIKRAQAAQGQHRSRLTHTDRVGIVDFSLPSARPRFYIVDLTSGLTETYLVAHGRGSDPEHTGWLRSFSNEPGSMASSAGAFVTVNSYVGVHGRSMRLAGMDHENCNAEARDIVIHAAPYVTSQIARDTGILGRSEGCFAVAPASRDAVLGALGSGRLLFAAKI